MARTAALPFTLRRSDDVVGATEVTSTRETVHGLLLLDGDRLVVQWRVARRIERVGWEIRSDNELEPVREFVIPLRGLASVGIRSPWWPFGRKARLVLTAADLRTFEGLVGRDGFQLSHPAELVLGIGARDRAAAREFGAELELALAELALQRAEAADARAAVPAQPEEVRRVTGEAEGGGPPGPDPEDLGAAGRS